MPAFYSENTMVIEKTLDYFFNDKKILDDALTHKSFYHENPDNEGFYNERLEFLGDTVLGLIISELLYRIQPAMAESTMARIKSYLVSGKVLSSIANAINLGDYVKLGKGEIGTGGRTKHSILADSIEALFGAVYIDGGFYEAKRVILWFYGDIIEETLQKKKYLDHKTELQEISQRKFGVLPEYRVIKEEGLEHKKVFTVSVSVNGEVIGSGTGSNKKTAETNAAKKALTKIDD